MMGAALYGAFGDELRKIAGVSLDGETRANMVARAGLRPGIEYLPGGQLPSNDPKETNFVLKIAGTSKFETKSYRKYKKYREPAKATLMGALPGAFVGGLLGSKRMGNNPRRLGALIGGGLGAADWVASGKARAWSNKYKSRKKPEIPKTKAAMIGSQTFTAGRSLMQSNSVGSFQDKMVHKGSRLNPLKVSNKFPVPSIPQDPTQ
jgi:hypothetical protein